MGRVSTDGCAGLEWFIAQEEDEMTRDGPAQQGQVPWMEEGSLDPGCEVDAIQDSWVGRYVRSGSCPMVAVNNQGYLVMFREARRRRAGGAFWVQTRGKQ